VSGKYQIMLVREKPNNLNNITESLKPNTRGLFKLMESLSKMTNMTIWGLDTKRWLHIDIFMYRSPCIFHTI
jgi:hypothetical protein